MKTYLECVPCFFRQALDVSGFIGADVHTQRQILDDVARAFLSFKLDTSPPEMGGIIHQIIKNHTGLQDPYRDLKRKSNRIALAAYDRMKALCDAGPDRLLTGIELAIAGNVIDFAIKTSLDIDSELDRILDDVGNGKIRRGGFFHLKEFKEVFGSSETLLFLADNAGETVFDRILMEQLLQMNPKVRIIYAVKAIPIINDALLEDAEFCDISSIARVISSGSDAPGTIPARCSDSFLKTFHDVDMVISKGQGNFEGLSDAARPIFFLFLAKCPVIARDVGCSKGDTILLHHSGTS
jgi:uncharacterized protein with ATP-grasp and redox domains